MKKEIELTMLRVARLADGEPFIMPVNEGLELEITSATYDLSNAIIALKNSNKSGRYRLTGHSFTVPEEFLFAGKLQVSIDLIVHGEVAKHWDCVPIVIKETETGFYAFGEIIELQNRITELEKVNGKLKELTEKVNEIITKQNELTETVSAIKENY